LGRDFFLKIACKICQKITGIFYLRLNFFLQGFIFLEMNLLQLRTTFYKAISKPCNKFVNFLLSGNFYIADFQLVAIFIL